MPPLLTIPDAAAVLAISPATLRRWCSTGRVAHRKVGGTIRFTQEDVEAIVKGAYRGVRESEAGACGVGEPLKWVRMAEERRVGR